MENSKVKTQFIQAVTMLALLASLFAITKIITEIKNYKYIGGNATPSTISFSGAGEVFAAPDIALVNITVREEAPKMADAQSKATAKEKAVLDYLEKAEVEKKDIKTESYNTYPKYDYGSPCYGGYCPARNPKVIGYEVSETIAVKVRDLTKAGEIASGAGSAGVSEISGPNFSIENEDKLRAEARQMAIEEAKAKAEELADALGVRLVRIVSFNEGGAYAPMYNFAKDAVMEQAASGGAAPALPTGQNKITSDVTITYEIR